MPIRRAALTELETVVAEVEAANYITSIGYPDEGSAVIHYTPKTTTRVAPGKLETRG